MRRGWRVALTPTAGRRLRVTGEFDRLAAVTGLPVRDASRLPEEPRPHPVVDCYVVAPASANTVAKLTLGIADNQALTQVTEAIGTPGVPVVVFPQVNAAQVRHPAWEGHLAALRRGGVELVYGPQLWPLFEPRVYPADRTFPWGEILAVAGRVTPAP